MVQKVGTSSITCLEEIRFNLKVTPNFNVGFTVAVASPRTRLAGCLITRLKLKVSDVVGKTFDEPARAIARILLNYMRHLMDHGTYVILIFLNAATVKSNLSNPTSFTFTS